jgi:hypothetical protein
MGGPWAVDNPDVRNLEEIGVGPSMPQFWPADEMPQILAGPVDLTALPRYVDAWSGYPWVRIPAASVLDAFADVVDWTTHSYEPAHACLEDLHRSFGRLSGPAEMRPDGNESLTYQRRVVRVQPDGRKVLQDTDTSMEDFVKAPRTPGWIPDSLPE